MRYSVLRDKRGVAVLPVMLLFGGLAIQIALALAAVALLRVNSNASLKAAADALFMAEGAVNDGILRVIRNKDFSSSVYTVANGSFSASVSVFKDQPVTGQTTVTASSTVMSRVKTVKAIVNVDATNGRVDIVSFNEL